MSLVFITDPAKRATYERDLQDGRVPQFDAKNRAKAEAWRNYFNTLLGAGTVTLQETTTFRPVINPPQG